MNVICCMIYMFDSMRKWNRDNVSDYKEIYVKVSMDLLRARDPKGLYSGMSKEKQKEVVGIHLDIEEPKSPNSILKKDGTKTLEKQVEEILRI